MVVPDSSVSNGVDSLVRDPCVLLSTKITPMLITGIKLLKFSEL